MKIIYLNIFLLFNLSVNAQYFFAAETKWNDEFKEWYIYTYDEEADEENEEELTMRWQMQNDWTEWEFRIFDASGSIKQTFTDDPNTWELRYLGETITARTSWKNDFSEWRITNNELTLKLKSRWRNNINEWSMETDDLGSLEMQTEWEDDPRVWEIKDSMADRVSQAQKMMAVFLVLFTSSPKI